MNRALFMVSAIMAVAACSDPASPGQTPPPTTYSVNTSRQWSGGAVLLRSSRSTSGHASRLVLAGNDSVLATAIDDSTYAFDLPTGPSATLAVSVPHASGGGADSAGSIDRVGYVGTRNLIEMNWGHRIWRPGGRVAILGYLQDPFGQVASIDLADGTVTPYPGLSYAGDYSYPVSPTDSADTFILHDSATNSIAAWRLTPAPARLDSAPTFGPTRQMVRLSDSSWIATAHHSVSLLPTPPAAGYIPLEETQQVLLSPDGRFAVVESSEHLAGDGVPVFDNHTGEELYRVPVHRVNSAAIAPDNRFIYLLTGSAVPGDSLLKIDATNGHVAGTVILPGSMIPFELGKDVAGGRLYVGARGDSTITVLVYDAESLNLLERLTSDQQCGWDPYSCSNSNLAVDATAHLLYLTQPGNPATVRTFDILP